MKHILGILLILLLLAGRGFADEPVKKLPVPPAAAQAESLKAIKEAFKDEYAKNTPPALGELSKTLRGVGKETKDDPVARFVLLNEACELAIQAGDPDSAMRAIDELAAVYAVEPLRMKISALDRLNQAAKTAAANRALIYVCLKVIDEAIIADDYRAAAQLVAIAQAAGKMANDKSLAAHVDNVGKKVAAIEREYEAAKKSIDLLSQKPNDPAANLAAGRFFCLFGNRWERGLPLLAKGSGLKLQAAAKKELAAPREQAEQLALANAWWELSEAAEKPAQQSLQRHACDWYQTVLPNLTGFPKTKVEKRLEQDPYPRSAVSQRREIDLLKLVDIERVAMKGTWKVMSDGITSDASKIPRLEFPYQPPAEFDFEIVFARLEGNDHVGQYCSAAGKQFRWGMDTDGGFAGFSCVHGNVVKDNPTKQELKLVNGRRYASVVKIRKDRVQAWLDGKLIEDWKTDYQEFSLPEGDHFPRPNTLGIGSYFSPTLFYSVKVTEITGVGKLLK